MPALINIENCSGCGICAEICPGDLIHMDEESGMPIVQYPDECWHCGCCRIDCPTDAIAIQFPPQMLI